jgi:thiol:disulfide interchange protein
MKTSAWTGWGMAALTVALAFGCAREKHEDAKAVAWNTSYDAALADAGKTGRPILLDFYTDW